MKLLLSLTLLVVFERCLSQGLECADCTKASSVDECRLTTVICAANERCFLEKVTTTTLGVAYNGGCRSKTVCDLMASLAGGTPGKRNVEELDPMTGEPLQRGQRDLLNCADCCEDAPDKKFGPCNLQLCGQKPSASAEACLVCPGVHPSSSSCKTKDTCQETQVCYTGIVYVNGLVRYQFGCEEKHLCAALVTNEKVNATTFRRDSVGLQLCDACCTGDQCNKADCFDLKKNMTLSSIGMAG